MLTVPTALLLHQTPSGSHYDWLIGTPEYQRDRHSRLWTARVALPCRAWQDAGGFDLTELPPHRRAYLTYQGPISGGRGTVQRIDQGTVIIRLWTDERRIWDIGMTGFQGIIEAIRLTDQRWYAGLIF